MPLDMPLDSLNPDLPLLDAYSRVVVTAAVENVAPAVAHLRLRGKHKGEERARRRLRVSCSRPTAT